MTHWAAAYIGAPWVRGAAGPDAFDCYGFVRYVQAQRYGRQLPDPGQVHTLKDAARALAARYGAEAWVEATTPAEDGDVVLMGRSAVLIHIGIAVAGNDTVGVLHCVERRGVMFQTYAALRATGWGHRRVFRYTP